LAEAIDYVRREERRQPTTYANRQLAPLAAGLGEAQHVAGRIAEGAVADAVGLVDWFLHHFGTCGPDMLEGGVAIVGREDQTAEQPYGLRDCAFRDPAGNLIRIQERR